MIDYSQFPFPKSRPVALDKADKQKAIKSRDKAENARARKRANGRCEVIVVLDSVGRRKATARCERKDTETHHLIGGIGRKNRGDSILAKYKIRVCAEHHREITSNILQPTTAKHDAATVRYWRSK